MSFFHKIKEEEKINLFLGDFIGGITGYPTRTELSKILTKEMKDNVKSYVKKTNSLFHVSQIYLDGVVGSKATLSGKLKSFFEYKKTKNDLYSVILDSNIVDTIITTNFDTSLEDFYSDRITKFNPYFEIEKNETDEKMAYYKLFGDFDNLDKVCVSKQDFRKLKVLPFYAEYWKAIENQMRKNSTVFLGVDLDDPDFIEVLSVMCNKENLNNLYMVTSSSVVSPTVIETLNNFKIKLLTYNETEFLKGMKAMFENQQDETKQNEVVLKKKLSR
ncbi:MAG: SIR2 family protein [Cetobacterium sp.]|uniref:SIR2 family protein n=1 Tax=Cetobacterium sp. TaxID=2071632 RepID=UPI002FCA4738